MNIYSLRQNLLSRILFSVIAVAMSSVSESTAAQADLSGVLSPSASTSNTVSVNQFLSSDKVLRTASRARQFLVDGRLDKAQEEIGKALHASPNCAIALDVQAAIHFRTGHLDDAAREFQEAIDADPTIGQAYLGLGILLIAHKRFKDALVPLERAESLLPAFWLAYFEAATADFLLGNMDATLKQIRSAEMLAASDPEKRSGTAYLRALVSIHLHDYAGATRFMRDVIKLNPTGAYSKPAQAQIEQMKPLLQAGEGSDATNLAHP